MTSFKKILALAILAPLMLLSACAMQSIDEESLDEEREYLEETYPEFEKTTIRVAKQEGEGYYIYTIVADLYVGDDNSLLISGTDLEVEKYLKKKNPGRQVSVNYK